jgi:hypothetical protein
MKIQSMKVAWHDGWSNLPSVEVTVDKIPEMSDMRYTRVDKFGAALFYAWHPSGYVSYFAGTSDHSGYGGSVFNVTLLDGTKDSWKGPWSSNSMSMNQVFPASCECVIIETVEGTYGPCRYAAHILLSTVLAFELDGTPTFVTSYGSDGETDAATAASLIEVLRTNPLAVIGDYALTFKKPGTKDLKESQVLKAAIRR